MAKAQVAQGVVDTTFVNPGSVVNFNAQSADKITVAYNWYVNDILKKTNDSINNFPDTIFNDSRIKVVPISDSGAIGDTFSAIFSVHIPDRIEWTSPSTIVCLVSDTTFPAAQVGLNLKGYTLGPGEKYEFVYSITNKIFGGFVSSDSLSFNVQSATFAIDTKKLGLGTFNLNIEQLYYGKNILHQTHIDYSVKNNVKGNNLVQVLQTLRVGLKPVIGKLRVKN